MGILDAPARRTYRDSLFQGLPIVATRGHAFGVNSVNLSNGTDTSASYRLSHVATTKATDIRLVFANHYNGRTPGPNDITIKASLSNPVDAPSGTTTLPGSLQVTFNGASTVTLSPGGFIVSDPVPVSVRAGQYIYSTTYVSVASVGMQWPRQPYMYSGRYEGTTAGVDLTASTTQPGTVDGTGYGPCALLGSPGSGTHPAVVGLSGDSIMFGSGDVESQDYGFAIRALTPAGIAYMQLATPGEGINATFSGTSVGAYRYRMALVAGCTHVLEEYRNDLTNPLATVQSLKLALWTAFADRGIDVSTVTVAPQTTSTDGWTTTGNQTVTSIESVRLAYNAWIRAGGPIDPTTKAAVAIGASGALLMGASGHPVKRYFEIADTVESARNSGFWSVAGVRSVADAAISSSSATLTSATAAFTTADKYKSIYIAGAGASGVNLVATIIGITNATTVVINTTASTTVSGAVARIGGLTTDGTHPSSFAHAAMATAIDTTKFV